MTDIKDFSEALTDDETEQLRNALFISDYFSKELNEREDEVIALTHKLFPVCHDVNNLVMIGAAVQMLLNSAKALCDANPDTNMVNTVHGICILMTSMAGQSTTRDLGAEQ